MALATEDPREIDAELPDSQAQGDQFDMGLPPKPEIETRRADIVDQAEAEYAYPAEFARFVEGRWNSPDDLRSLPEPGVMEHLLSVCYQASLLREEERPVTFRAVLAEPDLFSADGMPPLELQRLEFSRTFPFDAAELRRLSVACDPRRTLIGVRREENGIPRIWGLIHSGTWWLRELQGGRRPGAPVPPVAVVEVDAPGSMSVYKGSELIGRLRLGRVLGWRADPFASEWLPGQFVGFSESLMERHRNAAERATARGEQWAPLDPSLPRTVSHRMMKRVIALVREAHHGGTFVFLPEEYGSNMRACASLIDVKYRFEDDAPRRSFPLLVVRILNRLAQTHGPARGASMPVSWKEFEASADDQLLLLDEALFEAAQLVAGLASVDGAVVITKRHDLLGFGGMISGDLPPVKTVDRALDPEAVRTEEEATEGVGARHRSAYRLAGAVPGSVIIVISQDGGVRFVSQKSGRVTYWEQE